MREPKAFMSYSHDSSEHKNWVLKLAADLMEFGVDVTLDQWDLTPGQNVEAFMQNGIRHADFVLLVCSETYARKADEGVGGVGFEQLIVTKEVAANTDTRKFIPLIRGNVAKPRLPRYLTTRLYIDFSVDGSYAASREDLVRTLHRTPLHVRPTLGVNPFLDPPKPASSTQASMAPRGHAIALFRLKTQALDQEIATQKAYRAKSRKGTEEWKRADASLQQLTAERARMSDAVQRLTAKDKEEGVL